MRAPEPRQIWVPGAHGMLGQVVAREVENLGLSVVRSDIDVPIEDHSAVERWFDTHHFSHVINCAAYTGVDAAEDHPEAADAANVRGPHVLATRAASEGAVFIHFSTDYVFDGKSQRPYLEGDPCRPLGKYGESKRQGEEGVLGVLAAHPDFSGYIVRTSWLFGEGGACFPRTMLRLFRDKPELRVVSDQAGRPTYTKDLARATLELTRLAPTTRSRPLPQAGLYHFANSGPTTWHSFATAILLGARARGFPVKTDHIESIPTDAYPTRAARPGYSVLATSKIEPELATPPRPWELALGEFLDNVARAVPSEATESLGSTPR